MNPERWKEIESIYHAALERKGAERAAFLDRACGGDDELRREVEALLEQGSGDKSFLESPARVAAARDLAEHRGQVMIGRQVGSYRIVSLLGAGGMGEVYLAEDQKLERRVALKFLPEELEQDETARKRFLREARSAAALDHPFICHIHEVGEVDGISFIAMEHVEGETLDRKLAKGPIALNEALEKGIELAEALEAAHRHNIVHRDLKPSNIMLTADGHVKVMDFGLAKRIAAAEGSEALTQGITASLTKTGMTLGTVAYMSPEQLRGEEVDTRSDIFSLGIVVYEMFTGAHPFKKPEAVETGHAILNEDPESLSRHLDDVPPLLEYILKKMLAKTQDQRYQSVHEVRTDLAESIREIEEENGPIPDADVAANRKLRRAVWLLAAALAVALVIIGVTAIDTPTPPAGQLRKFSVGMPGSSDHGRISPDGKYVVFTGWGDESLSLLDLEQEEPVPLSGTEGGRYPFWSTDSLHVGFFTGGRLKTVPVSGGSVLTVCRLPGPGAGRIAPAGAFSPDGASILFTSECGAGSCLFEVATTGGEARLIVEPEGGELLSDPAFIPDDTGRRLVISKGTLNEVGIFLLDLDTGARSLLIPNARSPLYAPSGHLIYSSATTFTFVSIPYDIWAVPFSPESTTLEGEAFPVAANASRPSVAADGTLVYTATPGRRLVRRDRRGEFVGVIGLPQRSMFDPVLSPDGSKVAVAGLEETRDIWIHEVERPVKSRITFDADPEYVPLWRGLDETLFFVVRLSDESVVRAISPGGSNKAKTVASWPVGAMINDISRDGRWILYQEPGPAGSLDLWCLHKGEHDSEYDASQLLASPSREFMAKLSPNNRYFAYVSLETGRREVYVRRFPEGKRRWQVSTRGGNWPRWSRDGKELFFVEGTSLMAVPVDIRTDFKMGDPEKLFSVEITSGGAPQYDVFPGRESFVLIESIGDEKPVLRIVQNWYVRDPKTQAVP